jgi:hypothetical protein
MGAGTTLRDSVHWTQALSQLHARSDPRRRALSYLQVQQLARSHGRPLQPPPVLPLGSGAATAGCGEPQLLTSPACRSEADLQQQLAALPAQVVALQQHLAHLTSVLLLGPQTSAAHAPASLAARMPATGSPRPCSATHPQQGKISQAEAGPRPHPAESRRRRLLPLREDGAGGTSVVICPQEGELHLRPDAPECFAWLASVSSLRCVGKGGRFTACRVYDTGPTRCWQAHRVSHQRHSKAHLGVTQCLTIDRLEQAAAILWGRTRMS